MAASPIPHAALNELTIVRDDRRDPKSRLFPAASGALAARAAAAHPSLTSLSISGPPVQPQWLRRFAACLSPAGLPTLTSFNLSAHAHPGGCAEMICCLSLLPMLTSLNMGFFVEKGEDAPEQSLAAYTRFPTSPATASLPHLQQFCFREHACEQAHVECASAAPFILPFVSIPALTHVSLSKDAGCPTLDDLQATVVRYSSLRTVHIEAVLDGQTIESECRQWSFQAQTPPQFPPMTALVVCSTCPATVLAICRRFSSLLSSSLTSLTLCLDDPQDTYTGSGCTPRLLMTSWAGFPRTMRDLRALRELQLDCICGVPEHEGGRQVFSQGLASGLMCLSGLTRLQLRASVQDISPESAVVLVGSKVGAAVASLSGLQSLELSGGYTDREFDSVQPVLDACTQLLHLTSLELKCGGWTVAQLTELLPKLTALERGAFPSYCAVGGWDGDELKEAVRGLSNADLDFF